MVNANVFRDLDSSVSGGDNFPQGQYFFHLLIRILDFLSHGASLLASEKDMARDILKKSKILVMDEVRRLIIIVSSHTCRRF